MFAFVSAFPMSLHCTDEAQQAEIVLSAVLSITLLLLRAGEIPVFPRQRFRAVQRFHCRLHGQMHPTRLDLCSRSLLSTLLGNALSLAIGKAHYLGSLSTLAWHGVFSPTGVEHQGGHKCSHLCQPFPSLCTARMRPNRPKQFCLQF